MPVVTKLCAVTKLGDLTVRIRILFVTLMGIRILLATLMIRILMKAIQYKYEH